ncbi:hypothetical protein ZWY2020_034675 [Hordeum vulgare]|nr:hypothetical protein ZWY2020_034675 [Hordeum vulgare]
MNVGPAKNGSSQSASIFVRGSSFFSDRLVDGARPVKGDASTMVESTEAAGPAKDATFESATISAIGFASNWPVDGAGPARIGA